MENIIQFKNAPLKEAIFEIRFQPKLSIDSNRYKYHEIIEKEFPDIFYPTFKVGDSHLMEPFKFTSKDSFNTILTTIYSFAFSTSNYSIFSNYKKDVLKYLNSFCEMFKVERVVRTGLRYINIIPVPQKYKLTDYLKVEFDKPEIFKSIASEIDITIAIKLGDGKLRIKIKAGKTESIEKKKFSNELYQNLILLDFDYFLTNQEFKLEELDEKIEHSHKFTKSIFLDLISEKYRELLGR